MFNIFIDGVEGVGKTTFIKKISSDLVVNHNNYKFPSEELKTLYLTNDKSPDNIQDLFFMDMVDILSDIPRDNFVNIFDRSLLTQAVYNPNISHDQIIWLTNRMLKSNPFNILILLDRGVTDIEKSLLERNKEFNNQNELNKGKTLENKDKYLECYKKYKYLFRKTYHLYNQQMIDLFNINSELNKLKV